MPFDFGIWQIAIVLVIGLLVFGPKKLPELGRGLGSGMRDFRRGLSGEADNDPPVPPVVVQSTIPVVETAIPTAEPVAAAAHVADDAVMADAEPDATADSPRAE